MDVLFSTIRHQKISEINVGLFLSNIMSTLRKYQVKIEANFATLCVATVVLEGIGRQLDPEINILDQSVPFLFWSGKASLEDQMVYVREKAKDEMLVDGQLRPPSKDLMKKMVQLWKDIFYSGK
jgi:aarF domain-containing kinase